MSLTDLSSCARDCADRGLFRCTINQPECVCISSSWFNIYRPCVIQACPIEELQDTLDTTVGACKDVVDESNGAYLRDFEDAVKYVLESSTETATTSSPTRTPTSTSSDRPINSSTDEAGSDGGGGSSISGGAIAGIVAGSVILIVGALLAVFLIRRRHKKKAALFPQPESGPQYGDKWDPNSPTSPVSAPFSPGAVGMKPPKNGPRYSGSTVGDIPTPQAAHAVPGPQELPATSVIVEVEDPAATALAREHEREAAAAASAAKKNKTPRTSADKGSRKKSP